MAAPRRRRVEKWGSVFQRKGRPGWYARFLIAGRVGEVTRKAGQTLDAARRFLRQREREFHLGVLKERLEGFTIEEYMPDFLELWDVTEGTKVRAEGMLKIAGAFFGPVPMRQIEEREAQRFLTHVRVARGASRSTVHRYRSLMSSLFRIAKRDCQVERNPWRDVEVGRAPRRRAPAVGPDDVKRIYEVAESEMDRDDYLAIVLMGETGPRAGALADLEWRDVHEDYLTYRHTKTRQPRDVPLTPRALAVLEEARARRGEPSGRDHVFPSIHANRVAFGNRFARAVRRAELLVAGVHPNLYTLRHAFGTGLRYSGVELGDIKDLMGHTSINTTLIYADHGKRIAREAAIRRLARDRGQDVQEPKEGDEEERERP